MLEMEKRRLKGAGKVIEVKTLLQEWPKAMLRWGGDNSMQSRVPGISHRIPYRIMTGTRKERRLEQPDAG